MMRPSQYNYIKRMWTRNIFKSKEGILSKVILFPFRISLLIVITIIYAGFVFLFIGLQIIFKFIYEMLKIFFKLIIDLFVRFIKVLKTKKQKNIELTEKPLLYQIQDYTKEYGDIDIPSIQRKFKISYSKTLEIINELNSIEK